MSEEVNKAIERGLNCRMREDRGIECVDGEGKASYFREMHVFIPCEPESPEVKEIPKQNEPAPSQETKQQ